MRKFLGQLAEANRFRRQRAGLTALQTYQICTSLVREPRHVKALAPHVATMKRLSARKRRKQQPAPQPQQP